MHSATNLKEQTQISFVSTLTAFGPAATGSMDYVWNSFEHSLIIGIFFSVRRM